MTITAYPKPAQTITADQFRDYFRDFIGTGARDDAALKPSADSSGMNVKLAAGIGFVDGVLVRSTVVETIAVPASSGGGLSRIDTLVANLDFSATPIIQFAVISGAPAASNPQPPSLALSGSVAFRWPIADIAVSASASTITPANVTDRRTLVGRTITSWTDATRPSSPRNGQLGLNLTSGLWEWRDGAAWKPLAAAPTPHTHHWNQLTGFPEGDLASWASAAFAAKSHIHDISTVYQGGQPILSNFLPNNYAAKDHYHDISRILWNGNQSFVADYLPQVYAAKSHDLNSHTGVLPFSKGGTGQTDYLNARWALGIRYGTPAPSGGTDGDIYLRVL